MLLEMAPRDSGTASDSKIIGCSVGSNVKIKNESRAGAVGAVPGSAPSASNAGLTAGTEEFINLYHRTFLTKSPLMNKLYLQIITNIELASYLSIISSNAVCNMCSG
jgi:hypothetical protein